VAFLTFYHGDLQLFVATSRDGFHWERSSRTPLVAVAEDNNVWDSGNIQSVGNLFAEVDDELWIYYSGRPGGHKGYWGGDGNRPSYAATGLAKLRKDGFFSIDAADTPGVLRLILYVGLAAGVYTGFSSARQLTAILCGAAAIVLFAMGFRFGGEAELFTRMLQVAFVSIYIIGFAAIAVGFFALSDIHAFIEHQRKKRLNEPK
jgi:hypothetical protein